MTFGDAVSRSLARALCALRPALDIVAGRVEEAAPPRWCEARGWSGFLLALSEAELEQCEVRGLGGVESLRARMPADLEALCEDVAAAIRLPRLVPALRGPRDYASVSPRKRDQLRTMLAALAPMAEAARRIVDVGAGRGHFSLLAAHEFEREVLGIEREAGRVATANVHAQLQADGQSTRRDRALRARFVALDVQREGLDLESDDLVFGLHACGALGDRVVAAAIEAGADLALVSCCAQKIAGPSRSALSQAATPLVLEKATLGLSNLAARLQGVETTMPETMRARETRYALSLLLKGRGLETLPGQEMRYVNRRQAHAGLEVLAGHAFAAQRLSAPSASELSLAAGSARVDFQIIRRLSLPRNLLARLLEVTVVLDRAQALREADRHVCVATAFAPSVTPRNLAIFSSLVRERLPAHEIPCES